MAKKTLTPISSVIHPLMKLRAKLDRIVNITLRKEMGFGASLFRIMMALSVRPDITQKEIAEYWDVTEASVSRQIAILAKRGWIKKKPSLMITPLGTETLLKARGIMDKVFETIFKKVSDKKRKDAASIFNDLIKYI